MPKSRKHVLSLIYLVAPTLWVHPAFNTRVRSIAPDIEIYPFEY
jgi:hypothetical protein